jgi:hypothetical protein
MNNCIVCYSNPELILDGDFNQLRCPICLRWYDDDDEDKEARDD